jgi:hypothetical protein
MTLLVNPGKGRPEIVLADLGLTLDDIVEREAACVPFGPFWRQKYLERAPERVRQQLRMAALGRDVFGLSQDFDGPAPANPGFPPANLRAAINTTTTETNLWDPSIWALIPAKTMRAGTTWNARFGGVCGTTSTPAISFRARFGTNNSAPPTGADLGVGPTMTCGTFTAQPFYGEFICGCRSIGVAAGGATVTGNGWVVLPGAAAATTTPVCVLGAAIPTTIDQTVDQGVSVSVIWGTSSASNTLTPQWMSFSSSG